MQGDTQQVEATRSTGITPAYLHVAAAEILTGDGNAAELAVVERRAVHEPGRAFAVEVDAGTVGTAGRWIVVEQRCLTQRTARQRLKIHVNGERVGIRDGRLPHVGSGIEDGLQCGVGSGIANEVAVDRQCVGGVHARQRNDHHEQDAFEEWHHSFSPLPSVKHRHYTDIAPA